MALIVNKQPNYIGDNLVDNTYLPAFNPITAILINSTDNTKPSYRYICDVYINGAYSTRLKMFPDLGGYGVFEVERIIENYVSEDKFGDLNGFSPSTNSIIAYQLKYGEEWDTSTDQSGDITIYPNVATSSTLYSFNGVLQYDEYQDWDYGYYAAGATESRFLTNSPLELSIGLNDQYILSFFQTTLSDARKLKIVTYDLNGNAYGSYTITNGYYTAASTTTKRMYVGVGPSNLNGASYTTLTGPSASIVSSSVGSYEYYLINNSSTRISEIRSFNVNQTCTKYDPIRLTFLNRLGSFDYFTFDLSNKRSTSINRNEYSSYIGSRSGAEKWKYSIGDRGRTVINTQVKDSISANSNWMTEEVGLWLEELYTSPSVYKSSSELLYPVMIRDTQYVEQLRVNRKMINYVITFEYAYGKNIQRG